MIALIVARSRNNVIGRNGQIPWKIKGEQAQFKKLTTGNVVVMGRKSYEEIGHPLPNRMNIIVSLSAVSYTHLDVYKRQPSGRPADYTFAVFMFSAYASSHSPVSYTHLDVYKRQHEE